LLNGIGIMAKHNKTNQQFKYVSLKSEPELDRLAETARLACDAPMALISVEDGQSVSFKSQLGVALGQSISGPSLCKEALAQDGQLFLIEDARKDSRLAELPMVAGETQIVFYAGMAFTVPEINQRGVLAVMDRKKRRLSAKQGKILELLASQVGQLLGYRYLGGPLRDKVPHGPLQGEAQNHIAEVAGIGTWRWNIRTGEVEINEEWAAMLGYTREELTPLNADIWNRLIHPDDLQRAQAAFQVSLNKEQDLYEVECRFLHKSGEIKWIHDRGQIIEWTKAGEPLWMSGVHTDITLRKQSEQEKNRAYEAMNERVKEQFCLYRIARLGNDIQQLDDYLFKVAQAIPGGWQYPEHAVALLQCDDKKYKTPFYQEPTEKLMEERALSNGLALKFVVGYQPGTGPIEKSPVFLREEKELLATIADNVHTNLERYFSARGRDLILNSTQEGIYGIDIQGRCTFINPAAAQMLGYKPEDLQGERMNDIIHYQKKDGTPNSVEKGSNDRGGDRDATVNDEYFFRKDGSAFAVRYSSTPIIENGAKTGTVIVFSDITAEKQAEEELKTTANSLKNLKYALDLTSNLVLTDTEGYILDVNENTCQLSGYSREELIGAHTRINKSDYHDEAFYKDLWETIKTGQVWRGEIKNKRKDGSFYWVDTTIVPLRNKAGHIESHLALRADISERTRLQHLLEETNAFAKIGSWEYQVTTDEMYWSPTLNHIHEVEEDFQPTLEKVLAFYHTDFQATIAEKLNACIREGRPFEYEALMVTAQGREKWVRAIGKAEFSGERCLRIYGSLQDVHELKATQLQLKYTANNLPGAIFQYRLYPDGSDRVENMTAGSQLLFGLSPEACMENVNLLWQQIKAGGDYEQVVKSIEHSAKSLEPWRCRYRTRKPDGSLAWHDGVGLPQRLADGSIRWESIIMDVTETKEYETLLEEASALAQIGSWEVDMRKPEPRHIYCSPMTCQIIGREAGYSPEFEEGFGLFVPEQIDQMQQAVKRLINEGWEYDVEVKIKTPQGVQKWARCLGRAEHYQGKCLRIYGSIQDITTRKEAEIEIVHSNERFEKVARATNDVIWDWDIINDSLFFGERFEAVFGHSIADSSLNAESWSKHIHPEDVQQMMPQVEAALANSDLSHWQAEYRYARKDGSYAYVSDRGLIIRDKEGQAVRMVGAMTDVTEQKKYERSLKKLNEEIQNRVHELSISNAELEQFAYVASHDLQEPLRMVSSFLTQLEKKYGDVLDDKARRYIAFAVDGARRMRRIILDLLDFSLVGKHEESAVKVPLHSVIEEVKILLHRDIEESGARIMYEDLPVLKCARTPLVQIFQNLISNAIRYARTGVAPRVEISAEERSSVWQFAVSDNGIGIEEEYFDKIFVIFQRLHQQEEYGGTGMGLPIVKKQVESLKGRVWLRSKVGEGSTFYVTIPKRSLR